MMRNTKALARASANAGRKVKDIGQAMLWKSDPQLRDALMSADDPREARSAVFDMLKERELALHSRNCRIHALERSNSIHCIRVMRNFMSPRNERVSGESVIKHLFDISRDSTRNVSQAFVSDIMHIMKGTTGEPVLELQEAPDFAALDGLEGGRLRSDFLDGMAGAVSEWTERYPSGLEPSVIKRRQENRERIMDYLGASSDDWNDYTWHMRNVMLTPDIMGDIIELTDEEREAVSLCVANRIPFAITPYYLSLMDREPSRKWDHAVRAQVIPPLSYVQAVLRSRDDPSASLDFMMEGQTSPVELVTRRYPMIAIFKPYNTCAQICVYCQRNWEIEGVLSEDAMAPPEKVDAALEWFREHPAVCEVLITGGDPAMLSNTHLGSILGRLADIPHIKRIRLGTRVPVVLPMRMDAGLLRALAEVHDPPDRELAVVTHFEHPYEITPEAAAAIRSVRTLGVSVYNQQVFTMENCRRFETVALRSALKGIGVDPYYTFNAKGKEETSEYRVPIARLLQERKEEARLLPGLSRTDEPVFNIPALGKNHLRAWQHHDLISITPRGERIYEFHPWEKNITVAPTYVHRDVPIADFLAALTVRGEDPDQYRSIWYYF
ncbi:MAG TPA: KamA family radical SAM protein [Methanomassiliicoccales archaeon]|jgi:lysine 2,3-aminomutase|nr:KamA family radical SAM protein [Methanomassiliicoccales archaeon]